jgi:hypothetical protein
MQIMHNDGAGTCTKIDLGASFPKAQFTAYEVSLNWINDASTWIVTVINLNTLVSTTSIVITNLPTVTALYQACIARSSMANASTVSVDLIGIWVGDM